MDDGLRGRQSDELARGIWQDNTADHQGASSARLLDCDDNGRCPFYSKGAGGLAGGTGPDRPPAERALPRPRGPRARGGGRGRSRGDVALQMRLEGH
jgi:hypothetical protein